MNVQGQAMGVFIKVKPKSRNLSSHLSPTSPIQEKAWGTDFTIRMWN
jgi:hypothetical protein